MDTFGQVVRKLRLARRMTLDAVARKIGSHKGYVSGIENGKVNPPSVKIIRRYHKAFDVPGVELADFVELAWADKAPAEIRDRIRGYISSNPLLPQVPVEAASAPMASPLKAV